MTIAEIIDRLKSLANPDNVAGMARYGINTENTLGVSMPVLRKMGKETGKNHELAQQLWDSGIHEARILASLVDDPKQVTADQLERWVLDLDSWDVCDQLCSNLIEKTLFAYTKAGEWSLREEEFVKRAGFVLMARLAVSDKKAPDEVFKPFLKRIQEEAADERNMVKKAVNWALRQIGKRNLNLNKKAIMTTEKIKQIDSKAARWIANDAIRELTSEKIQKKLHK